MSDLKIVFGFIIFTIIAPCAFHDDYVKDHHKCAVVNLFRLIF